MSHPRTATALLAGPCLLATAAMAQAPALLMTLSEAETLGYRQVVLCNENNKDAAHMVGR